MSNASKLEGNQVDAITEISNAQHINDIQPIQNDGFPLLKKLKQKISFRSRKKEYIERQAELLGITPTDLLDIYIRIGSAVIEYSDEDTDLILKKDNQQKYKIRVKDWVY